MIPPPIPACAMASLVVRPRLAVHVQAAVAPEPALLTVAVEDIVGDEEEFLLCTQQLVLTEC